MIKGMRSRRSETELRNLLQRRWKALEDECSQMVNKYIQDCRNHIFRLVSDLPNSSSYQDFVPVRNILGDVDFKTSRVRRSEKSVKSKAMLLVQGIFKGLVSPSIHGWLDILSPVARITRSVVGGVRAITNGNENK
jgi:hypothetical protein